MSKFSERREYSIVDKYGVALNIEPLYTIWHALAWKNYYQREMTEELRITSVWIGDYDSEAAECNTNYLIYFLIRYAKEPEEEVEPVLVEQKVAFEESVDLDF